jgi:UDPglucose 6-dehydrogenase
VPEFLREGKAVKDFFQPDRLVFGVQSTWAERVLRALHSGIEAPVCVMSVESAQLSKYASNAMLATRLSFMNEIANIADVVGADIEDVERVVGSDKRIGKMFLRSGSGFGGSCFPKDVLALSQAARKHGYETRIIEPIIEINRDQPRRFVNIVRAQLKSFSHKTIAVWGLAFNGNTDDVRESPAIKVIELLVAEGIVIQVYDPRAMNQARAVLGDSVTYAKTAHEALYGAETLLVLTEWPEFMNVNWNDIAHALASPYVFDGKNFLGRKQIQEAGLIYCGIGICKDASRPLGN